MPGGTGWQPAWCVVSFDLGYYRGLIDKAYNELRAAFIRDRIRDNIDSEPYNAFLWANLRVDG